jgi:predicted nucleotidyltransferase
MDKQAKQKLFSDIAEFLKSKGATKVAVFGSYIRDEETPNSDIDVLTDFNNEIGLFDLIRIERELGELIGKKVDLVLEGTFNPVIQKYVDKDLCVLY